MLSAAVSSSFLNKAIAKYTMSEDMLSMTHAILKDTHPRPLSLVCVDGIIGYGEKESNP